MIQRLKISILVFVICGCSPGNAPKNSQNSFNEIQSPVATAPTKDITELKSTLSSELSHFDEDLRPAESLDLETPSFGAEIDFSRCQEIEKEVNAQYRLLRNYDIATRTYKHGSILCKVYSALEESSPGGLTRIEQKFYYSEVPHLTSLGLLCSKTLTIQTTIPKRGLSFIRQYDLMDNSSVALMKYYEVETRDSGSYVLTDRETTGLSKSGDLYTSRQMIISGKVSYSSKSIGFVSGTKRGLLLRKQEESYGGASPDTHLEITLPDSSEWSDYELTPIRPNSFYFKLNSIVSDSPHKLYYYNRYVGSKNCEYGYQGFDYLGSKINEFGTRNCGR